jgi:hypothetical protein
MKFNDRGASCFTSSPGWSELVQHERKCQLSCCGCHQYINLFPMWSQELCLAEDCTWLWHVVTGLGNFKWICICCDSGAAKFETLGTPSDAASGRGSKRPSTAASGGRLKRFKTCTRRTVTLQHLKIHHKSHAHRAAIANFLGVEVSALDGDIDKVAPSTTLFKELLHQFKKGIAPTGSYILPSGIVDTKKANEMLWTWKEAFGNRSRRHIGESVTMRISRDERHARLHMRYCCASDVLPDLSTHNGFLGQARDYDPSSLGKVQATERIYRAAFTKFACPPPRAVVKELFLESEYDHARNITEASPTDAAESEIVRIVSSESARCQKRWKCQSSSSTCSLPLAQ